MEISTSTNLVAFTPGRMRNPMDFCIRECSKGGYQTNTQPVLSGGFQMDSIVREVSLIGCLVAAVIRTGVGHCPLNTKHTRADDGALNQHFHHRIPVFFGKYIIVRQMGLTKHDTAFLCQFSERSNIVLPVIIPHP